jgi:FMN phosphatase YigB (HAD superfamily)
MFDLVIADYPDTLLNLTPPVPWVTFVTPSALDKKNKARANRYWSDLARLEIIRHPDTVDTARRTFFELWHGNRNPEIIGISLKLMLNYHDLNHEVVPLAKAFLKKTTDTVLKNDISVTLEAVMRQPSEKKY